MAFKGLQGFKRGYNGLQKVTKGYRGYKGLKGVTGGCRGLKVETNSYEELQRLYKGL